MDNPKAIPKKIVRLSIAALVLAGLILGGVQFVKLIRGVNEPPPDTFSKKNVEHRLALWDVKVSVLKVLYVNLDDEVFIVRVKTAPGTRAPLGDQPMLPTKSLALANGEAILAITRPSGSPEILAYRHNRLEKKWDELNIDQTYDSPRR